MPFPLPLVPFEQYMLLDERPAYPMNFFARLRFEGVLQRDALERAVALCLGRHPLLASHVQRRGWRLVWRPSRERPAIKWGNGRLANGRAEAALPTATPIDLSRETGLRIRVVVDAERSDLVLQFHHACCDGVGAFRFINDLLVSYDALSSDLPREPRLHRLNPQRLRNRGKFGMTPRKLLRAAPQQLVGLLGVMQFLMRKPVSLAAPTDPVPEELSVMYPGAVTAALEVEESDAVREAAVRNGVTTNDLLVRDLFLALQTWRERNRSPEESDWVRLAIPINLRTAADRRLPAANITSMVFLDRQPPEMADGAALLQSVHDEMGLIKRLRLGLTFVLSLKAAALIPGGIRRMAQTNSSRATCVLTNLGSPLAKLPLARDDGRLVAGDVTLTGMDLLAPIRPHTAAAVAVWCDAGRLHVTLHYDVSLLDVETARELLGDYLAQIRCNIARRSPIHSAV